MAEEIELTLVLKVRYPVDLESDAYSMVKSVPEALALDILNATDDPYGAFEGGEVESVTGRIIDTSPSSSRVLKQTYPPKDYGWGGGGE